MQYNMDTRKRCHTYILFLATPRTEITVHIPIPYTIDDLQKHCHGGRGYCAVSGNGRDEFPEI